MLAPQPMPSLFDYADYRRFLGDWFAARRRTDSGFSLRAFALKAGLPISNSSFFSKVISGKRNLTLDAQFRIAKAMKLSSAEIKYFGLLVRMDQSKDPEGKRHHFAELAAYAKSKPKVEESIRLLLDLGLISQTANGYALRDRNIAADPAGRESVGRLRIQEMLRLAAEAFPRVPLADRDYSAMTIYISKQGYQTLRERIRVFREDVKSLVDSDKSEDRIYTLAMLLFPNARLPEWGEEGGKP